MPSNAQAHVVAAFVLAAFIGGCAAEGPADELQRAYTPPPTNDASGSSPAAPSGPTATGSPNAKTAPKTDGPAKTIPAPSDGTPKRDEGAGGIAPPVGAMPIPGGITPPVGATPIPGGTPPRAVACATASDAVPAAYDIALLRAPDAEGLAYWRLQLQSGQERIEMLRNMVRSTEFRDAHALLADGPFVTSLYSGILGRASDEAGVAYWMGELAKGTSRSDVALSFVDSDEFRANRDHACFF